MIDAPIQTSADAIRHVRSQTDTVVLSYSTGKDSLASWLNCRPHFERIVPVYHYMAPGLEFVERYLAYIEERLETRIIRLPHPRLTFWLHHASYQPPTAANQMLDLYFPFLDYGDFVERVKTHYDVPAEAWVALGTTQNDSANRRLTFKQHGMAREGQRKLFPIGDFRKADIVNIINESGLKLPADYRIWRRSSADIVAFPLEPEHREKV